MCPFCHVRVCYLTQTCVLSKHQVLGGDVHYQVHIHWMMFCMCTYVKVLWFSSALCTHQAFYQDKLYHKTQEFPYLTSAFEMKAIMNESKAERELESVWNIRSVNAEQCFYQRNVTPVLMFEHLTLCFTLFQLCFYFNPQQEWELYSLSSWKLQLMIDRWFLWALCYCVSLPLTVPRWASLRWSQSLAFTKGWGELQQLHVLFLLLCMDVCDQCVVSVGHLALVGTRVF